jgi:hypothetical protein
MTRVTMTQQNWSGGELSPKLGGRYDLSIYGTGAEWLQNFISTTQGVASFRNGAKFAWPTRDNQEAILIPFEYSTDQAYILEFTALKMRIFKDGGIVTQDAQAITGITNANPAVVTYAGADTYANGDRIVLADVGGMKQVNNREFTVAGLNAGANTFQLSGIDSSGYDTYTSGGTVAEIVEVDTPYTEAELFEIDYAQTFDTVYVTHKSHAPYKIGRTSHVAWTLGTYSIISNPFGTTLAAGKTITGITKANPAVVTSVAHGFSNGDKVFIRDVVGMVEVNNLTFTVAGKTADTFQLNGINSTAYTTYASGGLIYKAITAISKADPALVTMAAHGFVEGDTVKIQGVSGMTEVNDKIFTVTNPTTDAFQLSSVDASIFTDYTAGGFAQKYTDFSYPACVTFFEQKLLMGGSNSFPLRIWGSNSEEGYDNFLTGTGDTDAFVYNLSSGGRGSKIRWMIGNQSFLAVGTAGTEFKVSGGGNDDAITPTNVSAKAASNYGSAAVKPLRLDTHILYLQRDKTTGRTFEFDALQDGYTSINRTLTADHIAKGRYNMPDGIKQLAAQNGFQNINWGVRNDGLLVGLTFEPREQVNGWHRHVAGGYYEAGKRNKAEYGSVAAIPRDGYCDQVWTTVKRTINGETVRYVEYFADQPNIPRPLDYYTGDKEGDKEAYLQDLWEAQKRLFFVDSGIVYDGSAYATEAITLSAVTTGTGRTITAAAALFDSLGGADLVGREIWGKAGGRAKITGYNSATVVTVKITVAFPDADIDEGEWYLTDDTFGGAQHLIGEEIILLADGGVVEGTVVNANGEFTTDTQHSYVVAGLSYIGIIKSMDLEGGGNNGPGQTKQKSLSQLGVKFLQTLGSLFGTDIYKLDRVKFRNVSDKMGRPPPLFDGVKIVDIRDDWEDEKHIFCVHDRPLPCNVQLYSPYMTTNDS